MLFSLEEIQKAINSAEKDTDAVMANNRGRSGKIILLSTEEENTVAKNNTYMKE